MSWVALGEALQAGKDMEEVIIGSQASQCDPAANLNRGELSL